MSSDPGRLERVVVEVDADRVDRALAGLMPVSRSRIQQWIADGRVTMDGSIVSRASAPAPAGAVLEVAVPAKRPARLVAEPIPLTFLYEDDACLVIDKPAGMVVHPGPGHDTGTAVHALLHHRPAVAGVGDERKAGLVHRLDKDTSGCLLVAKDDAAHLALTVQFADRTVGKTYWGFVWGRPAPADGTFDVPIGRSRTDRQKMSSHTSRARSAVTHYRTTESYDVGAWLEVELETGRTHQIRVHLAEAGHPVIGDERYGGGVARARGFHGPALQRARRVAKAAGRQALHACALRFVTPAGGSMVEVAAPAPADLVRLRDILREERR